MKIHWKTNHFCGFIIQFYFVVPKEVKVDSTHYFIMKISNERELQQMAYNQSSDIDLKEFTKNVLQNYILFI